MTVLKAQAPIIHTVITGTNAVLSDYLRKKTDKLKCTNNILHFE